MFVLIKMVIYRIIFYIRLYTLNSNRLNMMACNWVLIKVIANT